MASRASSLTAWVVRNRSRLPRFVRSIPDAIEADPNGLLSRLAYRALGGDAGRPEPIEAPEGSPRVLIGPTNHAGQGTLWARSLEVGRSGLGARSLAVLIPGGHAFPADSSVAFPIYHHSARWQAAEFEAVIAGFDHVLIESMRPIFGGLFPDVRGEVRALQDRGISVALMAHGTDVRAPRAHDGPEGSLHGEDARASRLEEQASRNRALAELLGLPVFVSTPDLLDDVPFATWCPVVVDTAAWSEGPSVLSGQRRPVVVHAPSSAAVKGTALIEPTMRGLEERGLVEYRRLENVPSADMPAVIRDADIVLDQFRLGSYGVAACEAMAAGRLVIGHVTAEVRSRVARTVGAELPIAEADAGSLGTVIEGLLADADATSRSAGLGPAFVRAVHAGSRSADALLSSWIERTVP